MVVMACDESNSLAARDPCAAGELSRTFGVDNERGQCVGQGRGVAGSDEDRAGFVERLGQAAHAGRNDRQSECKCLHYGDREPLPCQGQREDVACADHIDSIGSKARQDDVVLEVELLVQLGDRCLVGSLSNGDNCDVDTCVDYLACSAQQVRVIFAGAEVGDGAMRTTASSMSKEARTAERFVVRSAIAPTSTPTSADSPSG